MKKNAKIASKNDPTSRGAKIKFHYNLNNGSAPVEVIPVQLYDGKGSKLMVAANIGTGDPVTDSNGNFVPWDNVVN